MRARVVLLVEKDGAAQGGFEISAAAPVSPHATGELTARSRSESFEVNMVHTREQHFATYLNRLFTDVIYRRAWIAELVCFVVGGNDSGFVVE